MEITVQCDVGTRRPDTGIALRRGRPTDKPEIFGNAASWESSVRSRATS
jgi:hypothetical protein